MYKKIMAILLAAIMLVGNVPMSASAAEVQEATNGASTTEVSITKVADEIAPMATDYVDTTGVIAAGGYVQGTFKISGILSKTLTIIGTAGKLNGGTALTLTVSGNTYKMSCNGSAKILTTSLKLSPGTYTYKITNPNTSSVAYALNIYTP